MRIGRRPAILPSPDPDNCAGGLLLPAVVFLCLENRFPAQPRERVIMSNAPCFRRILLKISGEMLNGPSGHGIDPAAATAVAERIREASDQGVQVAVIVGAGNLFRGLAGSRTGMNRSCADNIGMLATAMNALALRDALEAAGLPADIQSAFAIDGVLPPFDQRQAVSLLQDGRIVLFAAGTGHPYFTTDTCAALRACEIGAEAVFKGTKVDGIYSADPKRHPDAIRYERLTFAQALADQLQVMDATAFSLCQDNNLPIVVFKFGEPGVLRDIIKGDLSAATLVSASI
jgi:uridylate kinase